MSTSIAAAVDQQGATTREIADSIQTAAGNTARASDEIKSVEQAASHAAAAIGEIGGWTARLSARAQDLEAKVAQLLQPRPGGVISVIAGARQRRVRTIRLAQLMRLAHSCRGAQKGV